MKNQIFRIALIALVFGLVLNTNAQSTKEEPIFGTVVVKKSKTDSTHKKSSFNLLRPAFFRLGLIGGATIGLDNNQGTRANGGGLLGLRAEYGLTNRFSVVGQLQNNSRGIRGAFPAGQASLGLNWMPFKSQRLQPFVGLAVGVGTDRMGRNGLRGDRDRFQGGPWGNGIGDSLRNWRDGRGVQGFGLARVGFNYVLARRIIGTVEGTYQLPFNGSANSNGGFSLAMGLSYQFGRIKK
jgi:hypothetical protein